MDRTSKCSRDDCPAQNVDKNLTMNCHDCKNPMHLMCYGIDKKPEDIFIIPNVVMLCNECYGSSKEGLSPKRKQPNSTHLVQRMIDVNSPILSLETVANGLTPPKHASGKSAQQQMFTVIESLAKKIDTNTATVAGLQDSVNSMKVAMCQQKGTVTELIKVSDEHFKSIKESLSGTLGYPRSDRQISYANVVKSQSGSYAKDTPKSSKLWSIGTAKSNTPVLEGSSHNFVANRYHRINLDQRLHEMTNKIHHQGEKKPCGCQVFTETLPKKKWSHILRMH